MIPDPRAAYPLAEMAVHLFCDTYMVNWNYAFEEWHQLVLIQYFSISLSVFVTFDI